VDKDLIAGCSNGEQNKYAGIGATVFFTAFMAFLAGSYALFTVFDNYYAATAFGLVWGLLIFNLDRFIVSSTGKGDGTDTITLKELGNATPRLAMAMILGFTISAPLEVYIFQKEIDKQFYKLDQEEQKAEIKKIEDIYTKSPEFNKLNKDKALLEEEIRNLEKEREDYQKRAAKENATEFGGCGPKCEEFKRMATEVMGRIDERKNKIADLDKKLQVYDDEKTAKIKELSNVNNSSHGLLDRLLALHAIPGSSVPAWMIRLMFVFIEIAPVLLKLMLIKSPYDYMSENVNQILETKQGINREHIIDENNKLHTMKGFYNPKRIIAIVEHQNAKEEENAKEAITLFAKQEKDDIQKDPASFVKPDNQA